MKHSFAILALAAACCCSVACAATAAEDDGAQAPLNPVIWADVPDVSVLRVDDTYYTPDTHTLRCPLPGWVSRPLSLPPRTHPCGAHAPSWY